jgi:DNA-3-methyladenine glycosylase I
VHLGGADQLRFEAFDLLTERRDDGQVGGEHRAGAGVWEDVEVESGPPPGLFEFLVLEGARAGLSWETILNKRESYREAFDGFDPALVAKYGPREREALLANPGIDRNRLKVEAAIRNAQAFLAVREEFGTFDRYLWQFVGHAPGQNAWRSSADVPARTPVSDAMSKDLKRRKFTFVGSTICYTYMQAVGLVNDYLVGCFRHAELADATSRSGR